MQGDGVQMKVNKLSSSKNLPYNYYSLPYCKPDKVISFAENLGEVLRGDRIENSVYHAAFAKDTVCAAACKVKLTEKQEKLIKSRIEDEYKVNMCVLLVI